VTRFHVPWSESPEDEFLAPDGQWYSVFRAVVFDSWLLWRDALPAEQDLRQQLTWDPYQEIMQLGRQLHLFHQTMPTYRGLTVSPFHVTRWWDPSDSDEQWNSGRSCLFHMDGYSASELCRLSAKRPGIQLRSITKRYVEASLAMPPKTATPAEPSPD